MVQFKLAPPFNEEMIEAVFPLAKPCLGHKFDLKIISPRNAVMGEVKNLRLPNLSQMYDFHPAPLHDILEVHAISGVISLKPTAGIPGIKIGNWAK